MEAKEKDVLLFRDSICLTAYVEKSEKEIKKTLRLEVQRMLKEALPLMANDEFGDKKFSLTIHTARQNAHNTYEAYIEIREQAID